MEKVTATTGQQRRLAAIMFTDMVGYTTLAQKNEELALRVLADHRKLLRAAFLDHGGHEVKTIGDAFLVEFTSALEAVRCALSIQRLLHERRMDTTGGNVLEIRIGIHAGDVVYSEDDIHGDAVNVASRIEPLAEPGGICLSDQVFQHVRNKLECPIVSLGRMDLKNVEQTMEVYKLVTPWGKDATRFGLLLDKRKIAILPLSNLSSRGSEDEYFADGMTEELISTICTISGLKVISRTTAMKFKNTKKSVPEIGRELNAGTILEGSVRRSGNRVRITLQLIDSSTDEHLWSQVYDRDLEDIFSVQSDIANHVSEALKVKLLPVEKSIIEKKPTLDPNAYELYLKGRYHLHRQTEAELQKAIKYFELALDLDPKFALALVGIAEGYLGLCDEGVLNSEDAFKKAEPLVSEALKLDDTLPEAYATLGSLLQNFRWDWAEAESRFRRAIELNPNWADVCHSYAVHLALRGRFEQAITEIRRAQELDPLCIEIHDCAAETYRVSYHFDSAIEECIRMLEIDPKFVPAYLKLGKTYLQKSMFFEAINAMEKGVEISGGSLIAKSYLAFAYGVAGRMDDALKVIDELKTASIKKYVSPFNMAIAYAGIGDKDATIEWLEKAAEIHAGGLLKIKIDPTFDSLRGEQRFVDLLRKIGLS